MQYQVIFIIIIGHYRVRERVLSFVT